MTTPIFIDRSFALYEKYQYFNRYIYEWEYKRYNINLDEFNDTIIRPSTDNEKVKIVGL
jgi:hypothetical protein